MRRDPLFNGLLLDVVDLVDNWRELDKFIMGKLHLLNLFVDLIHLMIVSIRLHN